MKVPSITRWSASISVVVLVGVPNRKDRRRSAVYPESLRRSGSPEEEWVYSGGRMRSSSDRGEKVPIGLSTQSCHLSQRTYLTVSKFIPITTSEYI